MFDLLVRRRAWRRIDDYASATVERGDGRSRGREKFEGKAERVSEHLHGHCLAGLDPRVRGAATLGEVGRNAKLDCRVCFLSISHIHSSDMPMIFRAIGVTS